MHGTTYFQVTLWKIIGSCSSSRADCVLPALPLSSAVAAYSSHYVDSASPISAQGARQVTDSELTREITAQGSHPMASSSE